MTLSWQQATPDSIDILDLDPFDSTSAPIWYRHKTFLESLLKESLASVITSVRVQCPPSTTITVQIIKDAIRLLRFEHPFIATKHGLLSPDKTPVFTYQPPTSEDDLNAWLDKVISRRETSQLNKDIDNLTYELGHHEFRSLYPFILFHFPSTSSSPDALVFFFNHGMFDAIGCFQFMDRCLASIAQCIRKTTRDPLPWGEEVSRLAPALIQSARIPHTAPRIPEDDDMIQYVKDTLKDLKYLHRFPVPHPDVPPTTTGLITRTLPPPALTSLRTAARAHGCTIYGVLMAAFALASIRIHSPSVSSVDPKTKPITMSFPFSPIDARPLASTVTDPHDRNQWTVRLSLGFNTYVTKDLGRFVRPNLDQDKQDMQADYDRQDASAVWTLGQEIKSQVLTQKKWNDRMTVWTDDVFRTVIGGVVDVFGDESTALQTSFGTLSSIGIMDPYLASSYPISASPSSAEQQSLTIHTPRLSPRFTAGSSIALHAFTWGGELICAFTYPEKRMGGVAEKWVEEIVRILGVCAAVESQ